jgi:hypothetical protein
MRLTIYVPDNRKPDIERFRSSMNFSELFMLAFNEAMKQQDTLDNRLCFEFCCAQGIPATESRSQEPV